MLRNFFAAVIVGLIICASSVACAEEIYVGNDNDRDCYVLTDTIYRTNEHRMVIISVTLKTVDNFGSEDFIDYKFFALDGGDEDVQFTNSNGDKGIANEYDTPLEWKIYTLIRDY